MADRRHDTEDRTRTMLGPGRGPAGGSCGSAILILIAHPDGDGLGSRTRLTRGSTLDIGRGSDCELAFPEVLSLSRCHARVRFGSTGVVVDDLGSTNGTFVNDRRVMDSMRLATGDRIQFGALHFKFFREEDVEAAYHEAIHHLVMQDGLTEIGNRRRFEDELAREFARAQRHERPLALVVFDIDRFKAINDSMGHLCGDFVLKRLARICSRRLRPEQVFARIGGDEFAILSPETALAGAMTMAERLCRSVAEHRFETDMVAEPFQVTCSFGCAELDAGMTAERDLLDAADRALYEAKESGRNQVGSAS